MWCYTNTFEFETRSNRQTQTAHDGIFASFEAALSLFVGKESMNQHFKGPVVLHVAYSYSSSLLTTNHTY